MQALPSDILTLLINVDLFEIINPIARVCHKSASYVRRNKNRLTYEHGDYDCARGCVAIRLPNGKRHGTAGAGDDDYCHVTVRYVYGIPLEWVVRVPEHHENYMVDVEANDTDYNVAYGHADSQFIICYRYGSNTLDFTICFRLDGKRVMIDADGWSVRIEDHHTEIEYPPLVGFMIDGAMQPAIVASWVDLVLRRLNITGTITPSNIVVSGTTYYRAKQWFNGVFDAHLTPFE